MLISVLREVEFYELRSSVIPPGNNHLLRLPGMLAEECLYTPLGNVKTYWGYPSFFRADDRPTLLGERVLLIRSWLQVSVGNSYHHCLILGE